MPGHVLELRADTESERLDVFLSRHDPVGTRSHALRLIRQGAVTVNGAPRKAAQPVHAGDLVVVLLPDDSPSPCAENVPLSILYEDDNVLVVDKPAGMVVHPAPGHSEHTLVNALLGRYPGLACGESTRPGIVHRLDKDTSGILVVALNPGARDWLIGQFKSSAVHKTYIALVVGRIDEPGTIDGAIGRHPIHRKKMALVPSGKPARTDYRPLEPLGEYTLVEARPITGRTHQIRVHLASIGHPLAGDRTYGTRSSWRSLESVLNRHFLHAASLSIRLPHDLAERRFTSPLPMDLQQALRAARERAGRPPCPPSPDMI